MSIHPTAIVSPLAEIDSSVVVGPYTIIEAGVEIASGVTIGSFCTIGKHPMPGRNQLAIAPTESKVRIGSGCRLGDYVSVYNEVSLGEQVFVGDKATIRERATIANDVVVGLGVVVSYAVQIGEKTKIMTGSNIGGEFVIGRRCFVGLHVVMFNDRQPLEAKTSRGDLPKSVIEDDVLIGSNSSIYPGLFICSGCKVAVGSVVTNDLKSAGVYYGIPARMRG